jgi:hypothetical protein
MCSTASSFPGLLAVNMRRPDRGEEDCDRLLSTLLRSWRHGHLDVGDASPRLRGLPGWAIVALGLDAVSAVCFSQVANLRAATGTEVCPASVTPRGTRHRRAEPRTPRPRPRAGRSRGRENPRSVPAAIKRRLAGGTRWMVIANALTCHHRRWIDTVICLQTLSGAFFHHAEETSRRASDPTVALFNALRRTEQKAASRLPDQLPRTAPASHGISPRHWCGTRMASVSESAPSRSTRRPVCLRGHQAPRRRGWLCPIGGALVVRVSADIVAPPYHERQRLGRGRWPQGAV